MSDFRPTPDWPREKNGWTQATGPCDARGMAYVLVGWDVATPVMIADFAAHDVRTANWYDEVPA